MRNKENRGKRREKNFFHHLGPYLGRRNRIIKNMIASLLLFLRIFIKVMQNVMKYQVVAVLVFSNIFHKLRSVAPDSFDGLEHINFTMLYDLLDTGIGCAVNPASGLAVRGDHYNGSVIRFLSPALNHIHELDQ